MKLSTEKILAEVEGGIGWLTYNHPERRNAMSMEMWQGVADALESFQDDPDVRVVVMTGAGRFIEVQGTAEGSPFTREQMDSLLELGRKGIEQLVRLQRQAIDAAGR